MIDCSVSIIPLLSFIEKTATKASRWHKRTNVPLIVSLIDRSTGSSNKLSLNNRFVEEGLTPARWAVCILRKYNGSLLCACFRLQLLPLPCADIPQCVIIVHRRRLCYLMLVLARQRRPSDMPLGYDQVGGFYKNQCVSYCPVSIWHLKTRPRCSPQYCCSAFAPLSLPPSRRRRLEVSEARTRTTRLV